MTRGYPALAVAGGPAPAALCPMGANALQSSLERYLDEELGR